MWRVRDMVLAPTSEIDLQGRNQQVVATVAKLSMQKLLLAHFRVTRAAGVQAELAVTDGNDPNAFAGFTNGRPVIGVNLSMLKLIGGDIDEFASLLSHEAAHLAAGHNDSSRIRTKTLEGLGTLLGIGLGAAGVPAAGNIAGLGVDLINAAYSRDQEREADALGVGYVMSAGFNPDGGIRLHEKLLKTPQGLSLPFLSSHPSSEERIENLKALIREKKKSYGETSVSDSNNQ